MNGCVEYQSGTWRILLTIIGKLEALLKKIHSKTRMLSNTGRIINVSKQYLSYLFDFITRSFSKEQIESSNEFMKSIKEDTYSILSNRKRKKALKHCIFPNDNLIGETYSLDCLSLVSTGSYEQL